ncbi:hypothetical protein [Pigmentiphaga kullae]|uniref:Uncharacterized protein n=1 Tax=Pigmentiphaga kullae TaxID=151784 RepID=A0A4Q7NCH7_9BURK|nr:hypothetical protein [Pigmentiphaga kullae]RZS80649.1 hypothetical protein EV675_3261 [Pigmentiphaga kullae]
MRDITSNILVVAALAPAVYAATKSDSGVIDLQGAGSVALAVNTGAIAGAGDFVISLQHGDAANLSDAETVAADDLIGTLPATLAAASVYQVGYRGAKRYVRAVITQNGGTSIAAGAVIIKGNLALAGTV